MPSLSALGEFKSSFQDIAHERDDVATANLTLNDLELPDTEAPPFEPPKRDALASGPSASSAGSSAGSQDSGDDGFDFSAFLGSLPGENSPPSLDDVFEDTGSPSQEQDSPSPEGDDSDIGDFLANMDQPTEDASTDDSSAETSVAEDASSLDDLLSGATESLSEDSQSQTATEAEDFSVPDGLLSGFSDEMESAPADNGFNLDDFNAEETPPENTGDDLGSEDLGAVDTDSESPNSDQNADEDLLSDIKTADTAPTDDVEASPASPIDDIETPPVSQLDDEGGIDLGGETLDMGGESPDISPPSDASLDDESLDLGGETPDTVAEETSAGDDFSLDGIMPEADSSAAEDTGADSAADSPLPETDFSVADDAGADLSSDSPLPETDFSVADDTGTDSAVDSSLPETDFPSADDAGLDLGEMDLSPTSLTSPGEVSETVETGEAGEASAGSGDFGLGDLGSDFSSESIELGSEPESHSSEELAGGDFGSETFGSDDDFSLPGLEDIFDKTKPETTAKPASKKGFFSRRKKQKAEEAPEAEDGVEEISLSQEDVDRLLKTLASYPLNLRVACEELIAEQVILPQQLSRLIRLLVNGAYVRETAALVEEITGKPVVIPRGYEKMTGAAFEAEQASFAYIFVHNFLPVFRLVAIIAAFIASVLYLGYKFVYTPIVAESLYKRGYERIPAGEYQRANELFHEAFTRHRKKKWFYLYADAFRDQRRYLLAEGKYDELLRYYPRDKKGVLAYANLETYYLMNYDKASRLLQRELLDYAPNDYDGLLAAGDNFLLWADSDPSKHYDKYEDARYSYARLLEKYGWQPSVVERMMKYFIHTDNLKEVLYLRVWFENDRKRNLSAESLAELGGYLLDKQLEETKGVPNPYLESIESVRAMLLQAVAQEPTLPEPHYHLARYHHSLSNVHEERLTLENAIRAFDLAKTESVRRRLYRVDTHLRYSNLLVNNREFFPAEEQLVRGIELYEDFLNRNLISVSPQLGQLYAAKGDLNFFVKTGDMEAALNDYRLAERYGYAPPEIQYRMGSAYYQLEDWGNALQYLFRASAELPLNRRLLFALGNVAYQRGDYFAAQGYYNRLLDTLETQRIRLPVLLPNDDPIFLELGERLMMARNNAGAVYEALADQTGNREYRSRAMALYAESARAWDAITRNPLSMVRMHLFDNEGAPSINLGYLNANNAMRPNRNYRPQIFPRIDKDVLEPSKWEELAPYGGLAN